jgi:hypothetical protein
MLGVDISAVWGLSGEIPPQGSGNRVFCYGGVGLTLRPIRPFDRLRAGDLGTQAAGRVKRYARGESSAVVGFFFVE